MVITLLDTSVASDNLGDHIIMDAISGVLHELFPDAYEYRVATHEYMTNISRKLLRHSDLAFVCGSNLLSSNMTFKAAQWKLKPWDASALGHAVLVGPGWRDYQKAVNPYTSWLLKRSLKQDALHSVRDRYTKEKLASLGKQVVNTSCPTMWKLTPEHCSTIPSKKADAVLTQLTWYRADVEGDKEFLRTLKKHYSSVYLWPQTFEDLGYFQSLGINGIKLLPWTLPKYNAFLENEDVDVVGSRLHGCIRALQKGKRTAVIPVDNRAKEISRDTGLPLLARNDVAALEHWIWAQQPTEISLPVEAIQAWKSQF